MGFPDPSMQTPHGPQFSFATPSTPAAHYAAPGDFQDQQRQPFVARGEWQYPQRSPEATHQSHAPPSHRAVPQQPQPAGAPPTPPPPRQDHCAYDAVGERTMLSQYCPPASTVLEVVDYSVFFLGKKLSSATVPNVKKEPVSYPLAPSVWQRRLCIVITRKNKSLQHRSLTVTARRTVLLQCRPLRTWEAQEVLRLQGARGPHRTLHPPLKTGLMEAMQHVI